MEKTLQEKIQELRLRMRGNQSTIHELSVQISQKETERAELIKENEDIAITIRCYKDSIKRNDAREEFDLKRSPLELNE